jgi:hypothetical protein
MSSSSHNVPDSCGRYEAVRQLVRLLARQTAAEAVRYVNTKPSLPHIRDSTVVPGPLVVLSTSTVV